MSYANYELTNTCFGRTTADLTNERSTTQKHTNKENTPVTLTTLITSGNTTSSTMDSRVSLDNADDTQTGNTPNSERTHDFNIEFFQTTPISQISTQEPKTTGGKILPCFENDRIV